MQDLPLINNNNGKLGQFIYHFSISTKKCRHKTRDCVRYCYADRGSMRYHQAEDKRYGINAKWTRHRDFVSLISSQIRLIVYDCQYFRIHTSGDFYNQTYFNKWVQIANNFQGMKFLAFTRNYELDVSNAPANLILMFSSDPSTKKYHPSIKRRARVDYQLDNYESVEEHLELKGKSKVCRYKCKFCRECWNGDTDVLFPLKQIKLTTLEIRA